MQFSNTSDKNGIIQRCEDYNNIGDGGISGDSTTLKKFTAHVNETLYDIVTEIMLSQDDFDWDDINNTDYPIGTFPLVAAQRQYELPTTLNFLTLKRVDVNYGGGWNKATTIDSSEFVFGLGDSSNYSTEDTNFSRTNPRYDPKSNGFWLYPAATQSEVDAGAKARIEFTREFDEFTSTDTTQEPGIDRQFHDLIAVGASLKWAVMKNADKARNLKVVWDEGVEKLRSHYYKKNEDAQLIFNPSVPSYK